jgi:hypothetical protein
MAISEDIGQEKKRISDRLARLDANREKLAAQLAELEAAERVLSRLGKPGRGEARRSARQAKAATSAEKKAPPRRGRGRAGKAIVRKQPSVSDAVLTAVQKHPEGISAGDVLKQLSNEGLTVRPNHLGVALQRHRRAGRLERRGELWYPPQHAELASGAAGQP